ncbi:GerMN domain-containing protein [Desulfoluna butyratoxydans]|uniref:Germn domain n=1 Tax=Desulfoluna butyratoxydans TaxID=231438 RepID=A0A4U8YWB0_9BACT|nr:GerMN domain-containing protein [Desulfoluna butyratoxydans]VFQ45703.1 germn domain [Desulfoluna butyratoxydans]
MTEDGKGQTGVFVAAAVATLVIVAIFSFFSGPDAAQRNITEAPIPASHSGRIEEESFFLYFAQRDGRFLTSEERTVSTTKDPWQLSQKIIAALIDGPERGSARTLPATTRLRALYITDPKVAVVDFSREIREEPMGAASELLTVYSVVNSLAVNIPEIDAVRILIEGERAETLAGHIDISEPLAPDMLMVR